jgi:Spy/CpxP family protein refolding chaperone
MSKRTSFIIAAVTAFSLCLPGFVLAFGPRNPCGFSQQRPNPRCMEMAMQNLDLTEAKQAALDEIKSNMCTQLEPVVAELGSVNTYQTVLAEEIDEAAAAAVIAETVELISQITAIKLNAKLGLAKILTPEQRQQVAQDIEECKKMGRGNGRPGRGGGMFK